MFDSTQIHLQDIVFERIVNFIDWFKPNFFLLCDYVWEFANENCGFQAIKFFPLYN